MRKDLRRVRCAAIGAATATALALAAAVATSAEPFAAATLALAPVVR